MALKVVESGQFDQSEQRPAWSPSKGDVIRGSYVRRRDGLGARNSTIYEFKLNDGTIQGVWSSKAIDDAIAQASIGDYFIIIFKGKKVLENGNNFNQFAIAVDSESPDEEEAKAFIEAHEGNYVKPAPATKTPAKAEAPAQDGDNGDLPF